MKKPTQKELIKDSHKRLANHYFKWSLLLLDYGNNLYKKGEKLKPKDKKKLKQNPEYGHEILKKIINEDFSLNIKGRNLDNVKDSIIEYDIQMEFEAQTLDELPEDFKAFVKSIGKEKNAAVACLVGFDRDEREGLDLEYGSSIPVMSDVNGKFSILTRPVIFTEKTEPVGDKGDIILADLSQYVVGLREEMRIDTSQHVYFATDESALRLIERHDGQSLWSEALTLEDGSTTVAPFVTLEAR